MKKDDVLKELTFIAQEHEGMLRPEDVVEYAKNKRTVLHGCFTWDDSEAAIQWRLQEARMLIRVAVTVLPNEEETTCRAFVSMKDDRYSGLGYRPMLSVLTNDEQRATMIQEALAEMEVFKAKYKNLVELASVFEEMEKVSVKLIKRKIIRKPKAITYRVRA